MAKQIKATLTVQVPGVALSSATHTLEVEATGQIAVTVPGESGGTPGELVVDVQPGDAGQVKLLMITADSYGEDLTYTVTGGSADVALDGPQIFVGSGAVGLLGATQNTITFSNSDASSVAVQIQVGRDATPNN